MLVEIVVAAVFSYVMISFGEWYIHKNVMHRKGLPSKVYSIFPGMVNTLRNHLLHHYKFFKIFDYEPDPAGRFFNITLEVYGMFLVMVLGFPLFFVLPVAYFTILFCVGLHHVAWGIVHSEMHNPTNSWFRNTKIFKFWNNYHRIHHEKPSYNFNIICPLADLVMGTYHE
jgi:hypothetical protein